MDIKIDVLKQAEDSKIVDGFKEIDEDVKPMNGLKPTDEDSMTVEGFKEIDEDVKPMNGLKPTDEDSTIVEGFKDTDEDLKPINGLKLTDEDSKIVDGFKEIDEDLKPTNGLIQTAEKLKPVDSFNETTEDLKTVDSFKQTTEDSKPVEDFKETNEDLKPLDVDLDKILEEVGVFRKYQMKYFFWLFFPVIFTSIHANNYIFAAPSVKTRCKTICDVGDVGYDPPWLGNAIPLDKKCLMYGNSTSYGYIDDSSCPADWFDNSTELACKDLVFMVKDSLVEELEINCDEWKRTLIGTIHSVGTLVALPMIGYVSDRFGRKFTLAISCVFEGVFGLIKSFSINYGMYMSFEFLEPALGSGVYTAVYIIAMEILVPRTRAVAGMFINNFFAIGQAVMAGISYGLPYWRSFLQASYAPTIILVVYWWILEESNRWLLSKGKYQEVINNVNKVAKVNGKDISEKSMEALQYNAKHESSFQKETKDTGGKKEPSAYLQVLKSRVLVLRLLKCSFWWITCVFCFYGLTINAVALAGSFHLNFVYAALVEIPAHFIGVLGVSHIGRKWTLFIAFIIGGLANFSFAFTPDDESLQGVAMTSYLIGKLFVTMAFSIIYLYTSEIFPTNLRHSLLAFCSMIGRIGSILAPQTPLLNEYMEGLPSILFGSTCIISALFMLTSPETLHLRLPETVEEAENLSSLVMDKKGETDDKNP